MQAAALLALRGQSSQPESYPDQASKQVNCWVQVPLDLGRELPTDMGSGAVCGGRGVSRHKGGLVLARRAEVNLCNRDEL